MDFIATFLEGLATFVSPCLLPMLPLYLAYFAGSANRDSEGGAARSTIGRTAVRVGGFVVGFTLVFVALGALAGSLGSLLARYSLLVSVVCGLIVVLFGLHFMGVMRIPLLDRTVKPDSSVRPRGFFSSLLFGAVFALGWTPCVGVFLGSALALAATGSSAVQGALLLLCYSLGLGIPFAVCAFAIDKLMGVLDVVKRHMEVVNKVCGALLVVFGLVMALSPLVTQGLTVDQASSASAASASAGQQASGAAASGSAATGSTTWNNSQLSDVAVVDSDNHDITLGTLCNGKATVINVWATWCPHCVNEMQDFQVLYDKYGDDVQFVMLNYADSAGEIADSRGYISENGFTFPVYYDTHDQAKRLFGITALPTTIIVDANGEVLSNKPGRIAPDKFEENLVSLL